MRGCVWLAAAVCHLLVPHPSELLVLVQAPGELPLGCTIRLLLEGLLVAIPVWQEVCSTSRLLDTYTSWEPIVGRPKQLQV